MILYISTWLIIGVMMMEPKQSADLLLFVVGMFIDPQDVEFRVQRKDHVVFVFLMKNTSFVHSKKICGLQIRMTLDVASVYNLFCDEILEGKGKE